MHSDASVERLLHWRAAQTAAAPPAPRAAELLELARPWWERWPDRFRARADRLARMPLAYGFAMAAPGRERRGHPVAVLLAGAEDRETYAHVLYFAVRDGGLRVRLELDVGAGRGAPAADAVPGYEATFVDDGSEQPLFAGHAVQSANGEYRIETALPEALADRWASVRATDRMPFRLILRPERDVG